MANRSVVLGWQKGHNVDHADCLLITLGEFEWQELFAITFWTYGIYLNGYLTYKYINDIIKIVINTI